MDSIGEKEHPVKQGASALTPMSMQMQMPIQLQLLKIEENKKVLVNLEQVFPFKRAVNRCDFPFQVLSYFASISSVVVVFCE